MDYMKDREILIGFRSLTSNTDFEELYETVEEEGIIIESHQTVRIETLGSVLATIDQGSGADSSPLALGFEIPAPEYRDVQLEKLQSISTRSNRSLAKLLDVNLRDGLDRTGLS